MKIGNIECYGIIYKITNNINKKIYIGQTTKEGGFKKRYDFKGVGIERVYNSLLCNSKITNKYVNTHLLSSIQKYGVKNFDVCEIFDIAFSKEELDIKEQLWIQYFNSTNREFGYNFSTGGSNGKLHQTSIDKIKIKKLNKNLRGNNPNSKKVICLNTKEVFNCFLDASEKYNANRSAISSVCNNKRISAGTLNGERLSWMYYEDYLNDPVLAKEKLNKALLPKRRNNKKVICLTTKIIFDKIIEAKEFYNITSKANISSCCKGKLNYAGKLKDGTPLTWMYYEDYLKNVIKER